jgi:prophage antirepressor-like protein
MDQLPIVKTALLEHFEDQEVPLYEVDGAMYLAGEDLGQMLGLADPNSIRKIFERNRDELSPHTCRVKMTRQEGCVNLTRPSTQGGDKMTRPSRSTRSGGPQKTRLYSEVGCYLVTMFAKTKKARQVRVWLASLPQRLRKAAPLASNQTTPAGGSMLETLEREFYHGVGHALRIFVELNATRMDISRLLSVIRWRVLGLPQVEVAKMVGLSLFTMQKYEKLLRDHGIVFPREKELAPVSGYSIGKMLMQAYKERGRRGTGPYLKRIK